MVGPQVSLDNTIGAAYLGVCFAAMYVFLHSTRLPSPLYPLFLNSELTDTGVVNRLFGITNLQTYIYFSRYPNDYLWQRVSVTALYLLDASHLSLTIAVVYHYLITEFGNLAEQVKIVGTFKLQIAVNVGIIVVVQTLYAIRVWRLGRHFHRLLPYGIFVVVFAGCAVGVILAVKTYQTPTFPALSTISWTIYLSFSTSTFIDLVIAAAMCWYLQSSRVKVERFASSAQASGQMSAVSANMGGVPSPTSPTNANGGAGNGEGRVGGGRPRRGTGTSGSSNMTPTGRIIWRLMQYVVASGLATRYARFDYLALYGP
ncbi:hypothetical protein ONZ45_g16253 [Pleurotus djamor]|nr:hypothetical protein ONZ45_g16253 [Pleurotus djamor]